MGIFTLAAILLPFMVATVIWKTVKWAFLKIVDAIEWRRFKKDFRLKGRVMFT